LIDQLEEGILGQMLQRELPLSHITGIGFAEDGVSVTWNDLTVL
jgi:hypothetical protein